MPTREGHDARQSAFEPFTSSSSSELPRPARVLLAEVDDTISAAVRISLQLDGLELLWARDGAEAVRVACEQEFDLVLVDLDLPVLTGLEVCRRLRDCPHLAAVPILLLSARYDPRRLPVGSLSTSVNGYLAKPFRVAELRRRVRTLLANGVSMPAS